MKINNYMTPTEAAFRWGISTDTLKDRLKTRNAEALQTHINAGLIKQFIKPGGTRGEWIISKELMELWYGPEPQK